MVDSLNTLHEVKQDFLSSLSALSDTLAEQQHSVVEGTKHTLSDLSDHISRLSEGISVLLYLSPHARDKVALPYLAVWPLVVFMVRHVRKFAFSFSLH